MSYRAILAASLALGAGCAPVHVRTEGPQQVAAVAPPTPVPFVPAGTKVEARLDNPIDTRATRPGAVFTATVTEPLIDSQGNVLVPAGATIAGTVASTGSRDAPEVVLRLESIATRSGLSRIDAKVQSADTSYYAMPTPTGAEAPSVTYGTYGFQPEGAPQLFGGAYGSQAPGYREMAMVAGARLQLVLTRPLVAPGTAR